jgi:2-keto-4-pentenoate hydratase/2-oxohepta-3-ene-1,7-dioic acid hydratase in catechol pathway
VKIICIGRNYPAHAAELKNEIPEVPVFFLKPETALVKSNRPVYLPDFTNDFHYELELVVKICKVGKCIREKFAHTYWDEVALGLDLTARDLQREQSQKGLPWEIAKAFDNSAPISAFFPKSRFENPDAIQFHLDLNGKTVQRGNSSEMIFSVDRIIAYVSRFFTLKHGDLIFTGTPAGVGSLKTGDIMEAYIEEEKILRCKIL